MPAANTAERIPLAGNTQPLPRLSTGQDNPSEPCYYSYMQASDPFPAPILANELAASPDKDSSEPNDLSHEPFDYTCLEMKAVDIFKLADQSPEEVIAAIRRGVPAGNLAAMAEALNLQQGMLADKLGLAKRTIDRKRSSKARLSPIESEKLLRLARIRNLARNLFQTDERVGEWLQSPAPFLKEARPLDRLDTEFGAREVEGLLLGMAYGNVL